MTAVQSFDAVPFMRLSNAAVLMLVYACRTLLEIERQ